MPVLGRERQPLVFLELVIPVRTNRNPAGVYSHRMARRQFVDVRKRVVGGMVHQ